MASFVERLQLLIEGNASGAVKALTETGAATEELSLKQKVAQSATQKLGLQGVESGQLLQGAMVAGAAVGGAALAKFAFDGVQHFADATAAARGFQRVLGGTAEDSSKLSAATQRMGIDAQTAQTAFGQLAKRIGEGTDTLGQWGVQIAKDSQGHVDFAATLANISQKYTEIQDPAQRAAFASENFGKGFQSINALLGQGKKNIQDFYAVASEHHEVFSQDDLNKGLQYNRAMTDVTTAFQGLELEIGKELLPTLTTLAHTLEHIIEIGDKVKGVFGSSSPLGIVTSPFENLQNAATHAADAVGLGGDQADKSAGKHKNLANAADASKGALKDAATAAKDDAAALADMQKATEDATQAILDQTTAVEAQFNTELKHEEAVRATDQALGAYAEAQKKADDSHDFAAQQEAIDKYNAARDAILGSADAAGADAKAQYDANTTMTGAAKAAGETEAAHAAYRDELKRVADTLAPGSPLRVYLDGLIGQLDNAATPRTISVGLENFELTKQQLDILYASIQALTSQTWYASVEVTGAGAALGPHAGEQGYDQYGNFQG